MKRTVCFVFGFWFEWKQKRHQRALDFFCVSHVIRIILFVYAFNLHDTLRPEQKNII